MPAPLLAQQQPQQQPARAEEPTGSRLIVGPDIKLKGVEITDCDTLVVEGRVEASMDSRVIQIAENGVFSGTVSIDVAEIRGRFEGSLTARKQLVIYSSGRVSGQIRYGKIRIEDKHTFVDIPEDLVERRRGGICYELNRLFAALLRALGFHIRTYHLNEGHAALLPLTLLRRVRRASRATLRAWGVRQGLHRSPSVARCATSACAQVSA
mgnify:CR=1 FL=1